MKKTEFLAIIVGVVCIIYSVLVLSIASGTLFFLVWAVLGIMFLGLAFAIRKEWLRKIAKPIRCILVGFVGVGFILFVFVQGCILSQFHVGSEEELDYIIVLGAQVYESGPSPVLKYRLNRAIDYLKENENTCCIVSGGQGVNEANPEAVIMSEYLQKHGIKEQRILLEVTSKNTTQNIKNSMQVADLSDQKVGIVTNNFHVYRAVHIAKKQGLDAVGIASDTNKLYLANNMLREFFGILKDFLFGNMSCIWQK